MNFAVPGLAAACLAGLVTSLHCAGMCGPLACAACVKSNGSGSMSSAAVYHGSRILSYGAVGFLAGEIGRAVSGILLGGATRWLTWAFVVFFVIVATGLDRRLRIPVMGAWMSRCLGASDASHWRAWCLGVLTPFIPCGPLYLIVGAAALSGSAWAGGGILIAFSLGTVPLMLVVQSQYFRMRHFSPLVLERSRRVLAALSVGILLYRGLGTSQFLCQ